MSKKEKGWKQNIGPEMDASALQARDAVLEKGRELGVIDKFGMQTQAAIDAGQRLGLNEQSKNMPGNAYYDLSSKNMYLADLMGRWVLVFNNEKMKRKNVEQIKNEQQDAETQSFRL